MAVELNITEATVRLIVEKARMIEAEIDRELENEPEPEPLAVGGTEHHTQATLVEEEAEDPTETELRELINDLNVDEALELVAIAWIGRGDYDPAEWNEALRDARARAETRRARVANYLLGLPLLADHVETGFDALIAAEE